MDSLLSAKRDVDAARRFFHKAVNGNGAPGVITLDAYAASHRAINDLKAEGKNTEARPRPFEQVSQ